MNKTKIEWTNYTWNPIVGCKHNCWYCYAKRMNDRFKWIKKWDEPKIFHDRISKPKLPKKPSKIFVCSIADLFGDWVPEDWICAVLEVVKEYPQHTFQFLTKNPKRYLKFDFPENCWLGVTITTNQDYAGGSQKAIEVLLQKPNYTFISFEPLMGDVSDINIMGINEIIIGAMTGMEKKNVIPKKEWIDSIRHPNIFYKNNIKKFL